MLKNAENTMSRKSAPPNSARINSVPRGTQNHANTLKVSILANLGIAALTHMTYLESKVITRNLWPQSVHLKTRSKI